MATLAHSQSKRQLSHAVTSSSSKSKFPSAYWIAFLVALVLCWSPSKLLAYFAPWIGILVMLLFTRSKQILIRLLLIFTIWMIILPIYAIITPGFVWHSALLSLFTYGTFIFVLTIPTKPLADKSLFDKILVTARWVLLFESIWGIVQGLVSFERSGTFDLSNGDSVAGTIRPFTTTPDFSNAMFAVNIAILLLLLFPSLIQENKGRLPFMLGCLALILASVVHVLIFLAISLLITTLIFHPSFPKYRYGIFLITILVIGTFWTFVFLPRNLSTLGAFVEQTINRETPRARVVESILNDAVYRYPWLVFIGVGPGQFSSRAGLIGTGMYFGGPANPLQIPLLPTGMSEVFERYVIDIWLQMSFSSNPNDTSSTYKPFFSWLSIFVEGGILAVLIALSVLMRLIWMIRATANQPSHRLRSIALASGIMFIAMLGAQENYWEVSQAIFVGVMMLQVCYSVLRYTRS